MFVQDEAVRGFACAWPGEDVQQLLLEGAVDPARALGKQTWHSRQHLLLVKLIPGHWSTSFVNLAAASGPKRS